MSIFDQAYDEMPWEEVCYRLPGELAVKALKRRITNLDTLKMFIDCVKNQPSSVKELREHVNQVLLEYTPEDIFGIFKQEEHPVLFSWVDETNKKRLKEEGKDELTYKFLFNLADSEDIESLEQVFDEVVSHNPVKSSEVLSVLNKVDRKHFVPFLNKVLTDSRPEVRALALCVRDVGNSKLISSHQKVIALKAMSKLSHFDRSFGTLDFNIFSELKPKERLDTLMTYLKRFPRYKKLKVFDPMPTEDELNLVLFAGCIEHNETVQKIHKMYKEITKEDPPKDEEDSKNGNFP